MISCLCCGKHICYHETFDLFKEDIVEEEFYGFLFLNEYNGALETSLACSSCYLGMVE